MCLLTYYPPHAEINTSRIECGADNNPDGHGFAVVGSESLIIGRGMKPDSVIERFVEARKRHPDTPAIFHSRIGTAGLTDKSNVHPFYVGGDRRTVLAHNGILPNLAQPFKGDNRSDTRILAERLLPYGRVGSLHSRRGRKKLAKWAGPGNKLAVLTVNPVYGKQAYLVNESRGEWQDNVWYSNDSYAERWWERYASSQAYMYVERGGGTGKWYTSQGGVSVFGGYPENNRATLRTDGQGHLDPDECAICLAKHSVDVRGNCTICLGCNDCYEHLDDCQCWAPEAKPEAPKHWWEDEGDDTLAITR